MIIAYLIANPQFNIWIISDITKQIAMTCRLGLDTESARGYRIAIFIAFFQPNIGILVDPDIRCHSCYSEAKAT